MTATVTELIQHQLLPRVSKPNRYLGNALHVPRKPLESAEVSVLLAFPDAYEIGLSNLGLRIVHHVLNQRPDTAAELTFAPLPDARPPSAGSTCRGATTPGPLRKAGWCRCRAPASPPGSPRCG